MDNHILDGVCYLWWPNIFSCGESVFVLSKDLLNLEPPPHVTLAMLLVHAPFYINIQELKTFHNYKGYNISLIILQCTIATIAAI